MSDIEDIAKRNQGGRAQIALGAVEVASWNRSCEIMRKAEALHAENELTPDRAQSLLIALLEHRAVVRSLHAQLQEGLRAAKRINDRLDQRATEVAKAKTESIQGRNRFVTRSKVPGPENSALSKS